MIKWIGQHIWDFVSRFRNEIYLEKLGDAGEDTDKFLVAKSDGQVAYRTGAEVLSDIGAGAGSGDITGVTITADDTNTVEDDAGSADFTIAGGEGIDTTATGTTITVTGEDASTSNKGVASFSSDNFAVSSGAVTIKSGGVDLANEVTGITPVANGGTGRDTMAVGSVLVGNDASNVDLVDMVTKGKILVGDGSGSPTTLALGTDDYVLTADASEATGVKWAATGGSNTTYDLSVEQEGGDNDNAILRLDPSTGSNDDITIIGGANATVTRDSSTQLTISSTNTNQLTTFNVLDDDNVPVSRNY